MRKSGYCTYLDVPFLHKSLGRPPTKQAKQGKAESRQSRLYYSNHNEIDGGHEAAKITDGVGAVRWLSVKC